MAFNSENLIVEITLSSGAKKKVYCKTVNEAKTVMAFSGGVIVGNYKPEELAAAKGGI